MRGVPFDTSAATVIARSSGWSFHLHSQGGSLKCQTAHGQHTVGCAGPQPIETTSGVFQVREDEPEPRVGAGLPRTPRARQDHFGVRDERPPIDRYYLGMDTRRRLICAFSGWDWP